MHCTFMRHGVARDAGACRLHIVLFTLCRHHTSRFAALSTLVLVPTDVATTLEDEPATLLWLWWRIVYW